MYENLKEICYDKELKLEAYRFEGVAQTFPNHFHEYYVIGLIEAGERRLTVNNREFRIGPGDLMTFNPRDNHACDQIDGGSLRYLCLNINREAMQEAAAEVFDNAELPCFHEPVQFRTELAEIFRTLHTSIMDGANEIEKEELFLPFIHELLSSYAKFGYHSSDVEMRPEITAICNYLQQNYAERITLEMLSGIAKINKYSLVRLFTRHMGITPYRYLETVRIGEAKKLLEQGVVPVQVAHQTGFSDQSHFSNYFSQFIGLTPGQYQAIFRKDLKE